MPHDKANDSEMESDFANRLTLEDFQHWTNIMVQAHALLFSYAQKQAATVKKPDLSTLFDPARWQNPAAMFGMTGPGIAETETLATQSAIQTAQIWEKGAQNWQKNWQNWLAIASSNMAGTNEQTNEKTKFGAKQDRRFAAKEWTSNPVFSLIRQSYAAIADQMLSATDAIDDIDPVAKAKLRLVTQNLVDAVAPTNFAWSNPQVMQRAIETRGESLLKGLKHMLDDLERGQMTHVDRGAFTVGENIAATPGKVVHETPLYQLIHYTPTTERILQTPLVIFPPWINRFYILDLNPAKSFVKWALEQGIAVFMVSWKSADASMKHVVWDHYIAAQIDAIDTIRTRLKVSAVHSIGYCVAGTTLAATLAILAAKGKADKVKSATFFTAQVDFENAGDLKLFVDDAQLAMLEKLSAPGYLDGRYMAAAFNMLRGRDLIWNYVVNNYLMGDDYPSFDLLYWNGDTTNLPAKWHRQYLIELYRDNRLVIPSSLSALEVPIDLRKIATPAYVQAGREDHIAPAQSVWQIMNHLSGDKTFLLAGSGHIAGVVNPPAAKKYQYWTGDSNAACYEDFVQSATETKGSWWPHWFEWLQTLDAQTIAAKGSYFPGRGRNKAIEDAPGRYVKTK